MLQTITIISGGFYSNQTGQISSCKHCNNGTFVSFFEHPGKSPLDCQVCPFGTNKSVFALHRACPCLTNYTRRNRFGPCEPCPSIGIICYQEYQQVNVGFFWTWKWPNCTNWEENLHEYEDFATNITKRDSTYIKQSFRGVIPRAYPCPLGNQSCSQVGIAPRLRNWIYRVALHRMPTFIFMEDKLLLWLSALFPLSRAMESSSDVYLCTLHVCCFIYHYLEIYS